MTGLYHIAPRLVVLAHVDYFGGGCHMVWADQEADVVLVKSIHRDEASVMSFEAKAGVERLPHPLFDQEVPLKDAHATMLGKHHAIHKGHKMRDVIKEVCRRDNPHSNQLMRLTVF